VPHGPKDKAEPTLRVRALGLLARREYTRRELASKLAPHEEDRAEIRRLLDEFEGRGWLSEARAVEQVLRTRRRKFGSGRIRHELVKRGVDAERVGAAMADLRATEREALAAVWRRKFGAAPRSAAERARQIRFLQGRGFELEMILRVIDARSTDDDDD
jgi:regulatory protein